MSFDSSTRGGMAGGMLRKVAVSAANEREVLGQYLQRVDHRGARVRLEERTKALQGDARIVAIVTSYGDVKFGDRAGDARRCVVVLYRERLRHVEVTFEQPPVA